MTWAENKDLLIGDMELGRVNASQYLDVAEREINGRLGQLYQLPIPADLPQYQLDTLKTIQANIATGRLLLAQGAGAESEDLHAYGKSLVKQGYDELERIGHAYELGGSATRVGTAGEDRRPSVSAPDAVSPTDTFYGNVIGQDSTSILDWGNTNPNGF